MKSDLLTLRAWERDDFRRLAAAAPRLSEQTLRLRFWGAVPTLPLAYLRSTERRWPVAWDAVAAVRGDDLVGWAEYGRYPADLRSGDVAVCVVDEEQGRGIGTALLKALLELARAAGLDSVHADIAAHNDGARRAWERATGGTARTVALRPAASRTRTLVSRTATAGGSAA